jgi:predicted DNA-binding transcriptional regulator AlpA
MTTAAEIIAALDHLDRGDVLTVLTVCAARLAQGSALEPDSAPQADELLNVEQTARLLGKSKSWLYHNQKTLDFKVNGIGSAPRFSRRGLEKYINRRVSKC